MTDLARLPLFTTLLEVSAELGADPYHVQGPGGNTSIKTDDGTMLVKASGFELSNALVEDMFTEVEPAAIVAAIRAGASEPLAGIVPRRGPKPSIETAMHALMAHRIVIHTHSVPAVAVSCRADAVAILEARLSGVAWAFVPYARPGAPLAHATAATLDRHPEASVLILGNHGIVVGGETPGEAHALLLDVVRRLETSPGAPTPVPDLGALAALAEEHELTLPSSARVHALALDAEAVAVATRGSLYPDHVIFLGPGAGKLAERATYAGRTAPQLWIAPGVGVLLERGLPRAAQAMAGCLHDVAMRLRGAGALTYLTDTDEASLLMMEEEVYRQELARRAQ